jgi:hypothetical protein
MTSQNITPSEVHAESSAAPDPPFGSNAIRLNSRQWTTAALLTVMILLALPRLWMILEPLADGPDYRLPYSQSEDYWQYARLVARAKSEREIAVIGDSVIWGEYVTPRQTLTHYLNEQEARVRFVNLGLNGAHPLALHGLVSSYATALQDEPVLVHCNLLWLSSPERDLQVEKELPLNHARLVSQFVPSLPCYKAPLAERMGIVVDRNLAVRGWAQHLRIAFFDGLDIPSWTLEHPYENPLAQIELAAAPSDAKLRHAQIPWFDQGIGVQDIPWIDLETSLQWQALRRTIDLLQARGNRVFVVVGPLNEHMLTPASRQRHLVLREGVESWLSGRNIPHASPPLLPSDEYADSSHPLSAGYERLAQALHNKHEFKQWLEND